MVIGIAHSEGFTWRRRLTEYDGDVWHFVDTETGEIGTMGKHKSTQDYRVDAERDLLPNERAGRDLKAGDVVVKKAGRYALQSDTGTRTNGSPDNVGSVWAVKNLDHPERVDTRMEVYDRYVYQLELLPMEAAQETIK